MKPEVIFVGQAPSRDSDPARPLSGEVLAELLGLPLEDFLKQFRRENLNSSWPGKDGKGDGFDRDAGEIRASELMRKPGRFVLLGASAAACFKQPWQPLFRTKTAFGEVFMLPHPSGVNLWWNKAKNRKLARIALKEFVNGD